MFKIFQGFHLVEAYQKKKKERRLSDEKTVSRIIRLLIPIFVSLVVWLMPTESFGIGTISTAIMMPSIFCY